MTDSNDGNHENGDEGPSADETDEPTGIGDSTGTGRLPLETLAEATLKYELDHGESVVDGVLEVVSTAQDCDPLALPPLYEAVDPEVLEALGRRLERPDRSRSVWCTFVFDRTLVPVSSDGSLYAATFDGGDPGTTETDSDDA